MPRDDALQFGHQPARVTAAAMRGAHADGFHIARPQRAPAMDQASLHEGCVADQLPLLVVGEGMHTSERMLPVGLGHVVEAAVDQRPRRRELVGRKAAVCASATGGGVNR